MTRRSGPEHSTGRITGGILAALGIAGLAVGFLPMFTLSTDDLPQLSDRLDSGLPRSFGGVAEAGTVRLDVGFYDLAVNWLPAAALPVTLILMVAVGAMLLHRPLRRAPLGTVTVIGLFAVLVAVTGLIRAPINRIGADTGSGLSDLVVPHPGAGLIAMLVLVAVGVLTAGYTAYRTLPR